MNQDAPDAPDGRMNQDAQDEMDPSDSRMDWMNQDAQDGPTLDRRVHFNHDRWLPITSRPVKYSPVANSKDSVLCSPLILDL